MDTLQPQKSTRKKSVTGSEEQLADKRIVDIENKLYSIRDTGKELQKKKPELLLYEAMEAAWKAYAAKDDLASHIENLKKVGEVKIPGTSIPLPPFDFDDPHIRVWLNERILQLRKNNPNLTYRDFLEMIARKTEHHNGTASHIADEEFLLIFERKITAMAPDLWEMEEFDWDDPKNQKMIQEEEETRIKKYGKLNSKQMDQIYEIKDTLLKENPTLSRKKAFDLALERVTGKKLPSIEK